MTRVRPFTLACCIAAALSLASLSTAQNTPPASEPAKRLQQLIDESRKNYPEADYAYDSWNAMRFAGNAAQDVARKPDATEEEVTSAYNTLKESVSRLQKRPVREDDAPRIGMAASLFADNEKGPLNNVLLQWATADGAERYELQRAAKGGQFETIYAGGAMSFKDYDLKDGEYSYRLASEQKGAKLVSNTASVKTAPMPQGLKTYYGSLPNKERLHGDALKAGDTYYAFRFIREDTAMKELRMQTSKDGVDWTDAGVAMEQKDNPELSDCKFEAENYRYDPIHNKILLFAHFEKQKGYGQGKVLIASATPGGKFTIHQIKRPLDVEVRDMGLYIDDDGKGYLAAASNLPGQGANATMYIFRLNDDFTDVVGIVAKIAEGGFREAPCIVKKDGFYYLFYSQASGWYPSQGGYVSAKSLDGPWSKLRRIGNTSTFASQSGGVLKFGKVEPKVPVMMGNRWGPARAENMNQNAALPIQLAQGFAFYDFHALLLHDADKSILVPTDLGRLLSQDRPVKSSVPGKDGHDAAKAFDGNYYTNFESDQKTWPYELVADLGKECTVRNVQISWFMAKGSEAFYTYTIEGSADGQKWTTLADRSDTKDPAVSKTYGFTSDTLPDNSAARFVKIKVLKAYPQNNPNNNWYPPSVYEVKVFGNEKK